MRRSKAAATTADRSDEVDEAAYWVRPAGRLERAEQACVHLGAGYVHGGGVCVSAGGQRGVVK